MKRYLIVLVLLTTTLFALSNQAKIDLIKIKLVEQQKKGQYDKIITSINEWKKIDRNIPISLIYWEGKAYYNTKSYIKSYKSLEKYINKTGRSGRFYQDALKLLLKVEPYYKKGLANEKKKAKYKNRVVSFTKTGLMWQDNYDPSFMKFDYKSAYHYCNNLKLGGFTDWRLPNINELMTIMNPTINHSTLRAFKNTANNGYSLLLFAKKRNSKRIHYVNAHYGTITYTTSDSFKASARCVRNR